MRISSTLFAALVLASLSACKQGAPPPAPPAQAANPAALARTSAPPPAAQGIHGRLAEKMDSGGYTYLRITTASGDTWAAVPQAQVTVGADIDVAVQMTMEAFTSKTLNRTFDKIIFGTLPGAAAAAPVAMGAPAAGQGGFAAAAPTAAASAPFAPAVPAAAPAAAIPSGPVAKAPGPTGKTVAEIFAGKGKLKDAPVTIHARVVKVTEGVLGKNWLHLKDGSGAPGSDDLTVTTSQRAAVGDVITIKGVVHLDRDFGSGYSYPVLIEEATLEM